MKKTLVVVVVVAAALAALFFAFRTSEGPIVLAFKYKKGQVNTYESKMTLKLDSPMFGPSSGSTQKMTMVMKQKVLKVNKDGSATIRTTVDPRGSSHSSMMPSMSGVSSTATVSKTGKPLGSQKIKDVERLMEPLMTGSAPSSGGSMGAILPPHGVAVGQSWTDSYPFPMGGGQITIVGTLVHDNFPLGKRKVCKIESKYDGKLDLGELFKSPDFRKMMMGMEISGEMNVDGKAMIYFSRDEGRIIKCDDKVRTKTKMVMGRLPSRGGSSTGASMTMEMVAEMNGSTVLKEKAAKGQSRTPKVIVQPPHVMP